MARGIVKCKGCGKKIRFVRKKSGEIIPVNAKATYILPRYDCSDTYYRANGTAIKGIYDNDGYACYEPHHCKEYAALREQAISR